MAPREERLQREGKKGSDYVCNNCRGGGGGTKAQRQQNSEWSSSLLLFYVLDLQFRVAMQAEAAAQADTLRDQVRDLNARVRNKNIKKENKWYSPPCISALQMKGR